jgi:alkylation response protein AidB-like acyl-CoA dehydrogenase
MTMDFTVSDDLAAHREAAHKWVEANVRPEWVDEQHHSGLYQTMELHELLARDGILGAGWPAEVGGSDVDPDFARAVFQAIMQMGFHADAWSTTGMVIHTIQAIGTDQQKQEYVAGALRGEVMIALGYSEPESGSDVAAAKTAAVRDGDEWVINGQKMFTSTAQVCSHVFVLARTDPDVPKHQGLTLFMVPTSSPGYECQPMHMLGGQTTTTTFYSDVRIPDSARIGEVNDGWSVMGLALVYERGVGNQTASEALLAGDLAAWARTAERPDGSLAIDDASVAARVGRIAIDEEVCRLLSAWANWNADQGRMSTAYGAVRKLISGEASLRNTGLALDVLGTAGVLAGEGDEVPARGMFEHEYRYSQVRTIYGGSSEIMRDIIAQKHLGLPRNRPSN